MNIDPLFSGFLQSPKHFPSNHQRNDRGEISGERANHTHKHNSLANGLSVAETRKLLNDQIVNKLDKTLGKAGATSLYELDSNDFTPEKVADRILSFVGATISGLQGAGKDQQSEALQQARKGIEKGFKEAKEILESLGVFKDEIKENAEKTYQLLQDGLEKLAGSLESGAPLIHGLLASSQQMAVERSSMFKQSFDFELTTKDGDVVKINVNKLDASLESAYVSQSPGETTMAYSSTQLSQSGYSISVEGHLDDDELEAIDNLLNDATQAANKYFAGDTQLAMDQLTHMGYDTSEIAGFTLELKEHQQTRETTAYQEVSGYIPQENSSSRHFGQALKPLQDYAAQLGEAHNQYMGNKMVNKGEDRFQQLLDQIAQLNDQFSSLNDQNQFNNFNSRLLA